MTLISNHSVSVVPAETDVDLNQNRAYPTADAYDLTLYQESGTTDRAVLEVAVIMNMTFDNKYGGTWKPKDKTDFISDATNAIRDGWSEKFQIINTNPKGTYKQAGVLFKPKLQEGMGILSHSHWNVTVQIRTPSAIYRPGTKPGGGSSVSNGTSLWYSDGLTALTPYGAPTSFTRRSTVHEFGHMLGYRDEYPIPPGDPTWLYNPFHSGDKDSIMYWGETIMPRHYVFLADWISFQWMKKDPANCFANDWKVSGTIDLTNAKL
jgi:hypothetical protein